MPANGALAASQLTRRPSFTAASITAPRTPGEFDELVGLAWFLARAILESELRGAWAGVGIREPKLCPKQSLSVPLDNDKIVVARFVAKDCLDLLDLLRHDYSYYGSVLERFGLESTWCCTLPRMVRLAVGLACGEPPLAIEFRRQSQ